MWRRYSGSTESKTRQPNVTSSGTRTVAPPTLAEDRPQLLQVYPVADNLKRKDHRAPQGAGASFSDDQILSACCHVRAGSFAGVAASIRYLGRRRDSSKARQRYSPSTPSISICIPPTTKTTTMSDDHPSTGRLAKAFTMMKHA